MRIEMRDVRVLSDATNYVVVHVEGRRFPGLVVQGDRLREWLRLARAGDPMSVDLLADELTTSVEEYERICGQEDGK
jgi:hypothetical protein